MKEMHERKESGYRHGLRFLLASISEDPTAKITGLAVGEASVAVTVAYHLSQKEIAAHETSSAQWNS